MLTPVDIHNKDFGRSFRGYNMEEIDDFLDEVVNDYEKLYRDNNQLKKELELTNKQLEHFHQLEKNLQDTLLVAQRTADEVTSTANSRAEEMKQAAKEACDNMLQNAELEAKQMINDATQRVRQINAEYDRIVAEKRQFIAKIRNLMHTELDILDDEEYQLPASKEEAKAAVIIPEEEITE